MNFYRLIKKGTDKAKYFKNAESDAIRLLVMELSGYEGADFLIHMYDEISQEQEKKIRSAIDTYLEEGKPVQYILGYSYFYGYKFIVNDQVLIPRPETEELVSQVLQEYDLIFPKQDVKAVDIGTGSGAIAISLALSEPHFKVQASDISESAIKVAEENAKLNNANVEFLVGDMLTPFIEKGEKFDILVSNPPYICDDEFVEDIVKNNEPNVALFGGPDGLKFYEIILANASKILNEKNIIAFEHSYSKGKEMLELAHKYFPNGNARIYKDLNGKDRIMVITNQ